MTTPDWETKYIEQRYDALERTIEARIEAAGPTANPSEIKDQVYQEQADRDRVHDEYVKTSWGS